MRGLEARLLWAKAALQYVVEDQSCVVTAYEAELLAFIDGAISQAGETVPPMLADEEELAKAWHDGVANRRNDEGFAHNGQWYWHCYQCECCEHYGEDVDGGRCPSCGAAEIAAGKEDLYDQFLDAVRG